VEITRIHELLRPFLGPGETLVDPQLTSISIYIDMLIRWNSRINLTAVRGPEEIVTRHFGESLFAARQLFPGDSQHSSARVVDVGSGPGFPGLPIKLWASRISLTLVESNQRKATFLREVCRALTLTDVDVRAERAESLPDLLADVVTLRAVEHFSTILATALRLVAPGGRLCLLIGEGQMRQAQSALHELVWDKPVAIPHSFNRIVLIGVRQ
jgi:16S rRNA (guanine527-N7)-methyltransferase